MQLHVVDGSVSLSPQLSWLLLFRNVDGWQMKTPAGTVVIPAVGRVQAGDGEALRRLALCGVGLVRLARFTVQDDIDAGRLIPVLEGFNPGVARPSMLLIHAKVDCSLRG